MAKIFQGFTAKIFIGNIQVGCCSHVSVEINDNVENYYGIERTTPETIITEGTQEISGHIKRLWVNTYYLSLLGMNVTPFSWGHNISFDLLLESSADSSSPFLYLYNCRFKKATINIPVSGWIEEEYDFISLSSATGELPPPIPPVPPIIPIEGYFFWNCSKPYYYNGWYYVFFQKNSPSHIDLYYARSNGTAWIGPILITSEFCAYSLHWGAMCVNDKVSLGWGNEIYYGTAQSYIKMGTIQSDGSISFSPKVLIANSNYGLASGIRAVNIAGARKFFFISSGNGAGDSADYLWISDDDGITWNYKGSTGSFGSYYWWNHRIIPFKDGNKFIQYTAPYGWNNWTISYEYRDPTSFGPYINLGSFNNDWYINDKGEGTLRSISNDVHLTWIDNTYSVRHCKINKSNPSVWTDLGTVDTVTSQSSGCSPCYDSYYDSIFIIYYQGNTIYYKRWIPFSGYGPRVTFYTGTLPISNLSIYPESLDNRVVIAWNEYNSSTGLWYAKCSALLLGPTPPPEWNVYASIATLFQLSPTYFIPTPDSPKVINCTWLVAMCEGIDKINSIISSWGIESGLGWFLDLYIISTKDFTLDYTDRTLNQITSTKDYSSDYTERTLNQATTTKDACPYADTISKPNDISSTKDADQDPLNKPSSIVLSAPSTNTGEYESKTSQITLEHTELPFDAIPPLLSTISSTYETIVGDSFTIEKMLYIICSNYVRSTGIFVDIPDVTMIIQCLNELNSGDYDDRLLNMFLSSESNSFESLPSQMVSISVINSTTKDSSDISTTSISLSGDKYVDVNDKSWEIASIDKDSSVTTSDKATSISLSYECVVS